ncbi:MAG: 2-hydroxyacid dehydrogenase [Burkholderiales bacterium]
MSIAFASRQPAPAWLEALRAALPEESIREVGELSDSEAATVDIAIVADPDPAQLARLTSLKWIHSVWAGVERLVPLARERALPLVRLHDPELARTMAEAVLAWTYYLQRDMPAYAAGQRAAVWQPRPYRAPSETTVTLVGLGELGSAAAARLLDAGFRVRGWSRTQKDTPGVECHYGLSQLGSSIADADIVVLLVPLTPETKGLFNTLTLGAMKRGASLINFARGSVIVRDALVDALNSGKLQYAVLDVFEQEPLPADDSLWRHPAVTVLPHISAPTNRHTAAKIVADNVRRYRHEELLPSSVNVERGY